MKPLEFCKVIHTEENAVDYKTWLATIPIKMDGPFSSVAEHWSRKPGVMSSNLIGGIVLV